MHVGDKLRGLRQARGLTVKEVAAHLDVPPAALSQIERGRVVPPVEVTTRAAALFDQPHEELEILAGRVPADIVRLLQAHPSAAAQVLRERFADEAGESETAVQAPTFTPPELAEFLAAWALRGADDTVLDPACGDGTMLESAIRRLRALGPSPARPHQAIGIDARGEFQARAASRLGTAAVDATDAVLVLQREFFSVDAPDRLPLLRPPDRLDAVSAVISNPTYAAVEPHSDAGRQRALRLAADAGFQLPERIAVWVPFLIHAASFVAPGGRLAVVVPPALLYARYASPLRRHLLARFPAMRVIAIEHAGGPRSGGLVVLLAEATGSGSGLRVINVESPAALTGLALDAPRPVRAGGARWAQSSRLEEAEALLRDLETAGALVRLGDLARIASGTTTGANGFFLLNQETVERYGIGESMLLRAIARARFLRGLYFTAADWDADRAAGVPVWLLQLGAAPASGSGVAAYLAEGVEAGIPARSVCRGRRLWFAVKPAPIADGWLTALAADAPRLTINTAGAAHTNALHGVFARDGGRIADVAAGFLTTAALLGVELAGRRTGRGRIKLEPQEAESIRLPRARIGDDEVAEWDARLRAGQREAIRHEADQRLLVHAGIADAGSVARLDRLYAQFRNH